MRGAQLIVLVGVTGAAAETSTPPSVLALPTEALEGMVRLRVHRATLLVPPALLELRAMRARPLHSRLIISPVVLRGPVGPVEWQVLVGQRVVSGGIVMALAIIHLQHRAALEVMGVVLAVRQTMPVVQPVAAAAAQVR